ncbi:MAG TPA: arginase family protein [Candidatus Dormibacteraeota bacterium]|nr:arginase family protein [Candidatus Dormibacteraeota bacterium]
MNLTGLQPWAGLAGATLADAEVAIGGISYDGSAVYRKGAAEAPARIRALSPVMPPVTEAGRRLIGLAVHDLGDLDVGPDIESGWRPVADRLASIPSRTLLTMVGGDHCATIPIVAAQARRHDGLHLVWVDAHPDLCDFSRGSSWSCGCALRRALEVAGLPPGAAAIAGGRDYDVEELEFIQDNGMLLIGVADLARQPGVVGERVARWAGGAPLHVSFDIDVLDPSAAPGTEIPSPGGVTTRQALDFLAALAGGANLVGLDVAEVSPPVDSNDITSLAALKLIFEFWGLAWKPRM